jgi:hypothetical protein
LWRWCNWPSHPLLGRPINYGVTSFRWRAPWHASYADIKLIREIIDHPLNRKLPGNSGVWIASGIYRDDKGLWFTNAYIWENHKIRWATLKPWHEKGLLQHQEPIWPSEWMHAEPGKAPGALIVNFDGDLQKILADRKQPSRTVGEWLSKYTLWRNERGLWVSRVWIGQRIEELTGKKQNDGVLRRKLRELVEEGRLTPIAAPKEYKKDRRHVRNPVKVYLESEVNEHVFGEKPITLTITARTAEPIAANTTPANFVGDSPIQVFDYDKNTMTFYEWCYIEYRVKDAKSQFPNLAPTQDNVITTYANRYAERTKVPKKPDEAAGKKLLALLSQKTLEKNRG